MAGRLGYRAPRPLVRALTGLARGALLMSGVWLAGAAAADITSARYQDPTTRYAHGVLGDAIEYGALELTTDAGAVWRVVLPQSLVFEDVAPRLWDVTGDGAPEVVVVESHQSKGARLAIYDETGRIAQTPYIGQRNRWLAPVGAGDLDGDGQIEVAYVDRPHLAKTLRVWRLSKGKLVQVASLPGVTNHQIGWDYIVGGLRNCAGQRPELFLADGGWRSVVAIQLDAKALSQTKLGPYSDAALSKALACNSSDR